MFAVLAAIAGAPSHAQIANSTSGAAANADALSMSGGNNIVVGGSSIETLFTRAERVERS